MRIDDLEEQAHLLNQPQNRPGTVAALSGDTARYTRFSVCMQSLPYNVPIGTAIKWVIGSDIAESRNQVCEDVEGDWVWFIDDDHVFRPDIVTQLLARDVDVVTPICLRRSSPFYPVPTGMDGNFLDLSEYAPDELVEVEAAGASGMLIRKAVLDALEPPWFELGHDGRLPVSEDVNFCRRARAAGFRVHVDMAVRLGHMTVATVWPTWSDEHDRWLTGFHIADGAEVATDPAAVPERPEA